MRIYKAVTSRSAVTPAIEHALANWLGEDPTDDQVELVTDRVLTGLQKFNAGGGWGALDTYLESSSTYVQTDLDDDGLVDYASELSTQLEDYGII